MKWILSFKCLGCGHSASVDRFDDHHGGNFQVFWREELGEGLTTSPGEYECEHCKSDEFIQCMTPDGLLRVDEGVKVE